MTTPHDDTWSGDLVRSLTRTPHATLQAKKNKHEGQELNGFEGRDEIRTVPSQRPRNQMGLSVSGGRGGKVIEKFAEKPHRLKQTTFYH